MVKRFISRISKEKPLVDLSIQLDNSSHSSTPDIILLQNNPLTTIKGNIIISSNTNLPVKKISLELCCDFKVNFLEETIIQSYNEQNELKTATSTKRIKHQSEPITYFWDNLLYSNEGSVKKINDLEPLEDLTGDQSWLLNLSPELQMCCNPETLCKEYYSRKRKSLSTVQLSSGLHSFPFTISIPTDSLYSTIESVHGISVFYYLKAKVYGEKEFQDRKIYKYIRVIRKLSENDIELSDSFSVANDTQLLNYQVNTPTRAVPIGGSLPLSCILDLKQNTKLEDIHFELVEKISFEDEGEEVKYEKCTKSYKSLKEKGMLEQFKQSLGVMIPFPDDFSSCMTDMNSPKLSVKHLLKMRIKLNTDGNLSTLKVNIPIVVYITPELCITGKRFVSDSYGIRTDGSTNMFGLPENSYNEKQGVRDGIAFLDPYIASDHLYYSINPPPRYDKYKNDAELVYDDPPEYELENSNKFLTSSMSRSTCSIDTTSSLGSLFSVSGGVSIASTVSNGCPEYCSVTMK